MKFNNLLAICALLVSSSQQVQLKKQTFDSSEYTIEELENIGT